MPRCPQCKKVMDSSETKCPFCGQPVHWEKKPKPAPVEEEGPVGRGGWMILLIIYLFANLINVIPMLGLLGQKQMLASGLCALYLVYDIIVIVLYFTRGQHFRTMGIFMEIVHSVYLVAFYISFIRMGGDMDTFRYMTVRTTAELLISGTSLGYFLRSKRVKNTFSFEE